jgi:hypothetical protein
VLLYLGALVVALWLLNQARRSFWLVSLLALPGTVCHELCHWVVGKLLNGRPVHFTVIPRREGRGFILGSVVLANLRWYNAFFIGLAPLLMLPVAYGLFLWRLGAKPTIGWPEAAMVFFLANLVFGAIPSWQDLRITARSPIGWLLLAGGLAWGVNGAWQRRAKVRMPVRHGRVQADMGRDLCNHAPWQGSPGAPPGCGPRQGPSKVAERSFGHPRELVV